MLKPINVVIVDDNKSFLDITAEYLSGIENFNVVGTAADGLNAIDIIKKTMPDIAVLDVIMPQLGGLDVLEKINRMSRKPQVIIISAFGRDEIMHIAMELGADYIMLKPFDLDVLASKIKQIYSLKAYKRMKEANSAELINEATKSKILNMLNQIGMPSHLKGYAYIEYAIEIIFKDLTAINSITKLIYSRISEKYDTTPSRVERVIRNAIEQTWIKGNTDFIDSLFDPCLYKEKFKPSNSEFLLKIVKELLNS